MKSKKNTVPIIFQPKKEDCDIKTITYVGLFLESKCSEEHAGIEMKWVRWLHCLGNILSAKAFCLLMWAIQICAIYKHQHVGKISVMANIEIHINNY